MSDFTVDDVLSARPSLRDRAKKARASQIAAQKAADEQQCYELEQHAREFMVGTLGLLRQDAEETSFRHGKKSQNTVCVYFTVDGLAFQCSYVREKVMERVSSEFRSEAVFDFVPVIEVRIRTSFVKIKSLEELGELL